MDPDDGSGVEFDDLFESFVDLDNSLKMSIIDHVTREKLHLLVWHF